MKKVLVFGGAFNPPTKAHLDVVRFAVEKMEFDEVLIIPSSTNQQLMWKRKDDDFNYSDKDRIKNCVDIFSTVHKNVRVLTHEIEANSKTSTYKSLTIVRDICPNADIYFLVGDDKIKQITRWVNAEVLLNEFKFLVVSRNGSAYDLINKHASNHLNSFKVLSGYSPLDISSTNVRDAYKRGDSELVMDLVHIEVYKTLYNKDKRYTNDDFLEMFKDMGIDVDESIFSKEDLDE